MAQSRYIAMKDGDTWESVSKFFKDWLTERGLTDSFGWIEGDILTVNEDISFFCFSFPERHGEKIDLFNEWAREADRLYGVRSSRTVVFPADPKLNVVLPPETEVEVPPWLR
ncbi:MAG: hypothetical protein ACKVK5_05990 [Pseudomonadales bacterium]